MQYGVTIYNLFNIFLEFSECYFLFLCKYSYGTSIHSFAMLSYLGLVLYYPHGMRKELPYLFILLEKLVINLS